VLRPEQEPAAGEEKPLADLMVVGRISNVSGSAERKGSGSWRGREDGNSSLLSPSQVVHCLGCCLKPLCCIERMT